VGFLIGYAAWQAVLIVAMISLPGIHFWIWVVVAGSSVLAMMAGISRNRPAARAPWLLLAGASLLRMSGHVADIIMTNNLVNPVPRLSAMLYLLGLPLYIAGFVLFIRSRDPVPDRRSTVDALILTLGLSLLAWVFLIRPYAMDTSESVMARSLASSYAIGDVVILGVLMRLLLPGKVRGVPALLVSTGIVASLFSDVATSLVFTYGAFPGSRGVGLGWVISYACWGAAALHPAMGELTTPCTYAAGRTDREAQSSRGRLLTLTLSALIAPVYLFVRFFFSHDVIVGVAAAACGVVFLLVLSRLYDMNLMHKRSLVRERTLRLAGACLASAGTSEEIGKVVRDSTRDLIGYDPRREALFVVRNGESVQVVSTASGDLIPRSELERFASSSLPRLLRMKSSEPRLVPAAGLPATARAIADRMGSECVLYCPLMVKGRPIGDPLIGVLAVFGRRRLLTGMSSSLGILAGQVALALERVLLSQEIIRQRGEALFKTLVQDASDVILIIDDSGTVRYATPSAATLYGGQVEGKNARELLASGNRVTPARMHVRAADHHLDPFSGLWRVTSHDGRKLLVEVRYTDLRDNDAVRGRVLTVRDVTEQHHLEEVLEHQAFHDQLTGLPNRALFADRASHGLALAKRNATIAAVLFVDLDDFKVVNDTMGHAVGDELLRHVAKRLQGVIRESDTAARLGGDEFALLIENLSDPNSVKPFADRVVEAFSEPFELPAGSVLTTATVGVATTEDSTDLDQLLRHADLALYAAKSAGKRRWHHYVPVLGAGMVRRREMRAPWRRASPGRNSSSTTSPSWSWKPG
jgi:diguanylate cyclase (GGDEF)-like protein/PAS domain S-box-containing protein